MILRQQRILSVLKEGLGIIYWIISIASMFPVASVCLHYFPLLIFCSCVVTNLCVDYSVKELLAQASAFSVLFQQLVLLSLQVIYGYWCENLCLIIQLLRQELCFKLMSFTHRIFEILSTVTTAWREAPVTDTDEMTAFRVETTIVASSVEYTTVVSTTSKLETTTISSTQKDTTFSTMQGKEEFSQRKCRAGNWFLVSLDWQVAQDI